MRRMEPADASLSAQVGELALHKGVQLPVQILFSHCKDQLLSTQHIRRPPGIQAMLGTLAWRRHAETELQWWGTLPPCKSSGKLGPVLQRGAPLGVSEHRVQRKHDQAGVDGEVWKVPWHLGHFLRLLCWGNQCAHRPWQRRAFGSVGEHPHMVRWVHSPFQDQQVYQQAQCEWGHSSGTREGACRGHGKGI